MTDSSATKSNQNPAPLGINPTDFLPDKENLPEGVSTFSTMVIRIDTAAVTLITDVSQDDAGLVTMTNRKPLSLEEVERTACTDGVLRVIVAVPIEDYETALRSDEYGEYEYLSGVIVDLDNAILGGYITIHGTAQGYHLIEYGAEVLVIRNAFAGSESDD